MSRNELLNLTDDDFFDPFFGTVRSIFGLGNDRPLPRPMGLRSDVVDLGDYYRIDIDMPGAEKKDIHVSYSDGYMMVEAEVNKKDDEKDDEGQYIRRERYSGSLSRSFYVGDIEEKDIKAKLDNGILSLTLPKEGRKAKAEKHAIAIE